MDCVITKVDRIVFRTGFEHADTRWTRIWRNAHPGTFEKAHMGSHDTWAVLRIETDTGHVGVWTGEAFILEGSWEQACQSAGCDPADMLVGRNPFERESIWQSLVKVGIPTKVAGAIDVSLWDLAGHLLGIPCYQIAGQCRSRIPTYVTTPINFGTPEEYAEYGVVVLRPGRQEARQDAALAS
jgi:L-alanine-DL-glutamate epimerase-like enolase superfamily enzyme